jgi:hypothetical protein
MYEQASERWSPVQSVEKVILSVISMLAGKYLRKSSKPVWADQVIFKNRIWRAAPILTVVNYIETTGKNMKRSYEHLLENN